MRATIMHARILKIFCIESQYDKLHALIRAIYTYIKVICYLLPKI